MPQEWIFQLFLGKLCVICFSLSHALLYVLQLCYQSFRNGVDRNAVPALVFARLMINMQPFS